jgi:O-antigen/teichoic acid export membrane protein
VQDPAAWGRLIRDVVLVGAGDMLKSLRILVVLPLLAKSLGMDAYGVWSQIKVTAMFLGPVASLGMTTALLRFLSGEQRPAAVREGFSSALSVAVAGGVTIAGLLLIVPQRMALLLFGDARLAVFVVAAGLYLILDVIDLLVMAYLRASRQMVFHVAAIAIELVGEATLVWWMVSHRIGLVSVVFTIIGWKALIVASKLGWTWRQIGIGSPNAVTIRAYLAFGIPLVLSGLSYLVVNYGDRFMVSFFMGIEALGLYAAAYAVGSLPIVLLATIDYVMFPAIAAEWNSGRTEEATRQVDVMLQGLVILLVPIVAGLAVLARPILATIATEAAGEAGPVALVVAIGFAVFYVGIVGERVLILANYPRTVTAIYSALMVVNAVLNLLLIPRWGLIGAATSTLLSFVLYSSVTLTLARRHCRFHLPTSILWKSLVAGIAASAVAFPLAGIGLQRIAVAGVAAGVTYGAMLLLVGGVTLSGLSAVMRNVRPAVVQQVD